MCPSEQVCCLCQLLDNERVCQRVPAPHGRTTIAGDATGHPPGVLIFELFESSPNFHFYSTTHTPPTDHQWVQR